MITVQTRQILAGQPVSADGSDGPPWVDHGPFDDFAAARPTIIELMQRQRLDNSTNIVLLADDLRPGPTQDPRTNILTGDDGHQIRVIRTDIAGPNGERDASETNAPDGEPTQGRLLVPWMGTVAVIEQPSRNDFQPVYTLRLPVEPIAHPGLPLPLRVAIVHQVPGETVGTVDRLTIVGARLLASGKVDIATVRNHDIGLASLLAAGQPTGAHALINMTPVPDGSQYTQENYWQVTGVLLTNTPLWWHSTQVAIGLS